MAILNRIKTINKTKKRKKVKMRKRRAQLLGWDIVAKYLAN